MSNFTEAVLASPFLGIFLSMATYALGLFLNKKTKSPILNPLLFSIVSIILILQVFHIPVGLYEDSSRLITAFLTPATIALALSMYRQRTIFRTYWPAIMAGTLVGAVVSIVSVLLLGKLLKFDHESLMSLVAKSVTTAISVPITIQLGGIAPIAIATAIITGIMGALLAPLMIKLFRVSDPVAAGLAIGTSSHAMGTSKALELGEVQGAMSGIALTITGIWTVLLVFLI